jgi:hypothetical protein
MTNQTALSSPHNPLINLLASRNSGAARFIEMAVAGAVVFQSVASIVGRFKEHRAARRTVQLKFAEGSEEYVWLARWLAAQPRITSHTQGQVFNVGLDRANHPEHLICTHSDRPTLPKWLMTPESAQGFKFEEMTISISKEVSDSKSEKWRPEKSVILTCVTDNLEVVGRLLDSIASHAAPPQQDKVPSVMMADLWGGWTEVRKLPEGREPVLPDGLLDRLTADLEWFNSSEAWYRSVGVPYRRGYLLYGIPGSGKTTTAISLASRLKKDIYILPLDGISDDRLMQLMHGCRRDGLVLLEDIDCVTATRKREEGAPKDSGIRDTPTLQGLLNCIDGVATPEGRVVLATTNHIDKLDPALIRTGRFDQKHEFFHATHQQAKELALRFGMGAEADGWAKNVEAMGVGMSTVQAMLIEECGLAGAL